MNIHSNVPDEGEQKAKAALNEAADQLEKYLKNLGSDGMCSEQEIQKFWEEAKNINGADIVADIIGDFAEIRHINGLETVEQLRSKADALDGKRTVYTPGAFGWDYTNVPAEWELREKAYLNEAADQLEQYLKDLGSDGMCSEQELKTFWEEAKIHNGADIAQQMRQNAKYAPHNQEKAIKEIAAKLEEYVNSLGTNGICSNNDLQKFWQEERFLDGADIAHQMRHMPARPGNHDLRGAFKEAADKFEIYLNDLGTNGKCSNKDVDQFFEKFLSEDENTYQASQANRDQLAALQGPWEDENTRYDGIGCAQSWVGASQTCLGAEDGDSACELAIAKALLDCEPVISDLRNYERATKCRIDPVTGEVIECRGRPYFDSNPGYSPDTDWSGSDPLGNPGAVERPDR